MWGRELHQIWLGSLAPIQHRYDLYTSTLQELPENMIGAPLPTQRDVLASCKCNQVRATRNECREANEGDFNPSMKLPKVSTMAAVGSGISRPVAQSFCQQA